LRSRGLCRVVRRLFEQSARGALRRHRDHRGAPRLSV